MLVLDNLRGKIYLARVNILPECCTLSWWGGLRTLVTLEAISAGTAVPGRFNLAGQVSGERSDELQHLALQVGGWAKGQ